MRLSGKHALSLAAALAFPSCADKGINIKESLPPPGVGPPMTTDAGSPWPAGGNQTPASIAFTPQEDISFTDPDNPDAGIPGLENLMSAPKKGPWEESETIARQTAAREGKPILIWFTDSARSPMCKALAAELFATPDFGKWAGENLVRLRIDANVTVNDPELSLDEKITRQTDLRNYVKRLKKRYRILGHPSVLMLNPSGEVITRYRGYKRGDADFYWGLIKQGVASSQAAYADWRKGLEKKGYREWEGHRGNKVFAKLASYSNGTLILIEPGGERYKTDESRLSKADRKWIAEQKAMRGIQ
ncbi:thioredoxin family protein [Akkermansiaceae bacterium]|nr:thioredoxin family protein [Akkermansiaceae bacterium]